ncbi:hypothetical protein BJX62DRAFT_10773 [Aspergillus germanicus]
MRVPTGENQWNPRTKPAPWVLWAADHPRHNKTTLSQTETQATCRSANPTTPSSSRIEHHTRTGSSAPPSHSFRGSFGRDLCSLSARL